MSQSPQNNGITKMHHQANTKHAESKHITLKTTTTRQMKQLNNARDLQEDRIIQSFSDNMSEMNRKNIQNEEKTIRTFNDERRMNARSHTKDIDRMKRQMTEVRDQTEGENFTALMRKDVKENQERNIRRMKKSMEDRDIRHEVDKEDLRNAFSDTLHETKRSYSKEIDNQVKGANTEYAKQIKKVYGEKDQTTDLYEDKLTTADKRYWKDTYNLRRRQWKNTYFLS